MICYNVITESLSLLLTDEFNKLPCDKKLRILRLYGRTHERQDYPDPIYTLKLFEVEVLYRQEFEGDVLHHKIRNDDTNEIKQTKDDQEGMCRKRFKGDALHHKIRKGDKHEILKFEDDFRDMLKQGVMPSSVERKRLGSYQCIEYCLCGIYIPSIHKYESSAIL